MAERLLEPACQQDGPDREHEHSEKVSQYRFGQAMGEERARDGGEQCRRRDVKERPVVDVPGARMGGDARSGVRHRHAHGYALGGDVIDQEEGHEAGTTRLAPPIPRSPLQNPVAKPSRTSATVPAASSGATRPGQNSFRAK